MNTSAYDSDMAHHLQLTTVSDLLRPSSSGPARLRELLARPEPLLIPGCFDALGARLIEQAGFDAAYMTGFGTSASLLGRPDVGLLGLTDMVDNARRIVNAVDVPVVADADTGYGNPINVIHTLQLYEQAGVAGLHIEDQVSPKRCGHMEGKQVIERDLFLAKIRAAVEARTNPDFLLIARTDSRAPHGLDEALERARAARDSGADMLFVEALQSRDELETVVRKLDDVPLLFNWVEGGKTPGLSVEEITELGFALVIFPITLVLAATRAMQESLAQMRASGTPTGALTEAGIFDDFTDLIGLPEITKLEERFS